MKKVQKPYTQTPQTVQRAIADPMCTKHRADVKFIYKWTEYNDFQCNNQNTGVMMRRPSECALCRTGASMTAETLPNKTKNHFRINHIVSETESEDAFSEWHCGRQSLNGIMR